MRRAVVVGLARSGRAAALAMRRRGVDVVAVDRDRTLDVGELGPRTVFAGIKSAYAPESLEGKLAVVVATMIRSMSSARSGCGRAASSVCGRPMPTAARSKRT